MCLSGAAGLWVCRGASRSDSTSIHSSHWLPHVLKWMNALPSFTSRTVLSYHLRMVSSASSESPTWNSRNVRCPGNTRLQRPSLRRRSNSTRDRGARGNDSKVTSISEKSSSRYCEDRDEDGAEDEDDEKGTAEEAGRRVEDEEEEEEGAESEAMSNDDEFSVRGPSPPLSMAEVLLKGSKVDDSDEAAVFCSSTAPAALPSIQKRS